MRKPRDTGTPINPKRMRIKDERKKLIKRTKDKILNVSGANETVGGQCIVCGNEIKKNQAFRTLPKDKNCQEVRLYHAKTCGPESNNWRAFKANVKKAPDNALLKAQLSFK